jgi:hypothetical protein
MHENAHALLSAAEMHAPCFVNKITPHLDMRLGAYLRRSIAVKPRRLHSIYGGYAATALHVFLTRVQAAVSYTSSEADDACAAFAAHAAMQQADHSGLLLDTEILLNNVLYSVACKSRGLGTMITLQCSTVKCVTSLKPVQGPAYLGHGKHIYKVFDQSKRVLKDTNVCCLPRDIRLWLRTEDGEELGLVDTSTAYANAEDAFLASNYSLWLRWKDEIGVERIAVDERYTSELAALHVEDKSSPIYMLLFDEKLRNTFLSIRNDYAARHNRFVSDATDFFWQRRGGRLLPIRLGQTGTLNGVEYTPKALAAALRAGQIFSDKYVAYMVRSLLPGVLAVGGTSQQDYLSLFQQMTIDAHRACPFIDRESMPNFSFDLSSLGGRPLLEPSKDLQAALNMFSREPLLPTLLASLGLTIAESIGTLDCASYLLAEKNGTE